MPDNDRTIDTNLVLIDLHQLENVSGGRGAQPIGMSWIGNQSLFLQRMSSFFFGVRPGPGPVRR